MLKVHTPRMGLIVKLCLFAILLQQVVSDCGSWSDWSVCSVTCGTGLESRTRTCFTQKPGEEQCGTGPAIETKKCRKDDCAAQVKFKEVGCFKDARSSRAFPTLVANLRGQIDWHHMEKTVEACAELVHKKGWPYFGLQFYGECWSGANGNYSKYGKSNDCWSGVGKINANYVYEMNSAGEVVV